MTTEMYARYQVAYHTQSDIQHHLGLLHSLARGNVLELGTRGGVSTTALLAGVELRGGHVWSIDIEDCAGVLPAHPQWTFMKGDSRDADLSEGIINAMMRADGSDDPPSDWQGDVIDLILVDTFHAYEQTQAELALWGPRIAPGGSICLHDIETFPGVRRAAREFADAQGWPITYILPCHGMAVIERPIEGVSAEGAAWAMERAA